MGVNVSDNKKYKKILEILVTFLSVIIANFIIQDGQSNWLEGSMLLVTYAIIALSFLLL
jgi:Ca2+:H+ antiporter|tara:strand:+ start:1245 stop:1421 length:177 start_codon:yes stop_codon:yes gene_type:complete